MRSNYFLVLILILFACKNGSEIESNDLLIPASTLTQLNYTAERGTSGDKVTGLLGYGYDVTGLCDTTSGRAKILDLQLANSWTDYHNSSFATLISADNFTKLINQVTDPNFRDIYSGYALSMHLKSLLRLAYNTDSMDSSYAFTYYASTYTSPRHRMNSGKELKDLITDNFKKDVDSLSSKELIAKYGTHVLTDVILGRKMEVLYRIKSQFPQYASNSQEGFFRRMSQFGAYTFGVDQEKKDYSTNEEQMVFNSTGCTDKICEVLNATDNNPDKIRIDSYTPINSSNKLDFISVGDRGIWPLYDLISDSTKKHQLKEYIEEYMASKSDVK